MNLSPRARTALQIAGYVALALITFVLALHLTFPYGRVKDKIVEAMSAKYDVTIGGVERSFVPGRFALTAVTLRSRPSVANEPVTTMYFKRVEVDIAFAPLLSKKVEIGLDVATAQGSMAGVVRLSSQATFVDFTLKKVPLATIPGIGDAVGLPLGGNADGRLTLDLPTGDWSKAKGKLDLTCTIGCTVGDGVTKIFPKARRESDQAFVKDGTVVPEIKITRFALGIDIAKGEAKSRKFDLVSPDGEAQLDFNIKLAKRIGDSTINGCISYKCSDELKSRAPKFAGTCDFGSPAVDERGFHDIKLSGKLTSMRRIGTTCDASGDDAMSGGVDRARARPNIDATPPTPVRPSEPPTPQPMPPPVDLSKPIDADKLEAIKGIDPSIGSGSGTGAAPAPGAGTGSAELAPAAVPPPLQPGAVEPPAPSPDGPSGADSEGPQIIN